VRAANFCASANFCATLYRERTCRSNVGFKKDENFCFHCTKVLSNVNSTKTNVGPNLNNLLMYSCGKLIVSHKSFLWRYVPFHMCLLGYLQVATITTERLVRLCPLYEIYQFFFLISDNLAFHSFVASCLFFSEYKNYFAETSINIFLINRPGLINVFIKACISCYSSGCGCRTSFSAAAIP